MAEGADRLSQAVALEKKARELEAQGRHEEAFREYKNALEVFKFVYKWENNPKVKEMMRERLENLVEIAERLKTQISSGTLPPAPAAGPPMGGRPAAGGGATATAPAAVDTETSAEDKEAQRLRKGLEGAIMTTKPNVSWDDIAGLKAAKEALQETVILPTRFPQLFTGSRKPWKGILLYGPPGTGKTHLAKACATEASATFFTISSSDLVSKWMGESERLVKSLFEMAREGQPSIIFIDEVDSLCGARGESGESDAARRIKTELLGQMDGVKQDSGSLLVLGATNTPWDLDTAIRRRFEKRIYIPLPEAEARTTMLKLSMGSTPNDLSNADLVAIAKRADGFSGADISILVRDAIFEPVRRCRRAKTFKRVSQAGPDGVVREYWTPCSPGVPGAVEKSLMDVPAAELLEPRVLVGDFELALEKCRPSVSPGDLKAHEEFTKDFGMDG
jgi:vacuolar protein-sorting-associated protein 4